MNMPSNQSLDYMDGWCCGWNRARVGLPKCDKAFKNKKSEIDGWNARNDLAKEMERTTKAIKRIKKELNKTKNRTE